MKEKSPGKIDEVLKRAERQINKMEEGVPKKKKQRPDDKLDWSAVDTQIEEEKLQNELDELSKKAEVEDKQTEGDFMTEEELRAIEGQLTGLEDERKKPEEFEQGSDVLKPLDVDSADLEGDIDQQIYDALKRAETLSFEERKQLWADMEKIFHQKLGKYIGLIKQDMADHINLLLKLPKADQIKAELIAKVKEYTDHIK